MKQTIFTIATIVAVLSLPMETSAKGNSFGKAVLLKDANGVAVGRVIGMEAASWPYVLTREGYRTQFKIGNGMVQVVVTDGIYYTQGNCEGDAYLAIAPRRKQFIGTVFSPINDINGLYAGTYVSDGLSLMYSPINAQSVGPVDLYSFRDADNICTNDDYLNQYGFPAYPNDPDITGIANTPYPNRMRIE